MSSAMSQPKAKACKVCQEEFIPFLTTAKVCSVKCAMVLSKSDLDASRVKKERKALSESRKQTRADKARIKTLTTLCKEARKIIQKFRRLEDIEKYGTCICCGIFRIDDGAHRYPVGSKYRTARLSLNPEQINGACSKCNRFVGGGNVEGYIAGIIKRYGTQKIAELEELKRRADHKEDAPLTKPEVVEIKKHYSRLIRNFETERL